MSLIQDALKRRQQESGQLENADPDPNTPQPELPGNVHLAPPSPEDKTPAAEPDHGETEAAKTMPVKAAGGKRASRPWAMGLLAIVFVFAILAAVLYLGWFALSFLATNSTAPAKTEAVTPEPAAQPGTETGPAAGQPPATATEAPGPQTAPSAAAQTADRAGIQSGNADSPAPEAIGAPLIDAESSRLPAPTAPAPAEPPAKPVAEAAVRTPAPTPAAPAEPPARPVAEAAVRTPAPATPAPAEPPAKPVAEAAARPPVPTAPAPAEPPARPVAEAAAQTQPEPEPEAIPVEWPSLKLSAIVRGKSTTRGAAIINGKIVEVGGEIEGVTIISVDEDGIKLKNGPEVRTLRVGGML